MYASRYGVYKLWQSLGVGRNEFLHATIFQHVIHYREFARKALQILLVGAELTCLGHLGLFGNAQLGKENLAQLTCGVDVERGLVGLCAYLALKASELAVELHGVVGKLYGINLHACKLYVGQHLNHGLLHLLIERLQLLLLNLSPQQLFELQGDVGILAGILLHRFDVHLVHGELSCTLAYEGLDGDGSVAQITLGHVVHIVA